MNNEIEENEYIRTIKGTIARIEDTDFVICFDLSNQVFYKNWSDGTGQNELIVKHSKNIIDLVEERRLR